MFQQLINSLSFCSLWEGAFEKWKKGIKSLESPHRGGDYSLNKQGLNTYGVPGSGPGALSCPLVKFLGKTHLRHRGLKKM